MSYNAIFGPEIDGKLRKKQQNKRTQSVQS